MKTNTKLPSWIRKWSMILPEIIIFTIFLVIQLQHINIDFWNDEIYTLKHFTFVPLEAIVTDYHVPNNHILFNLINSIYLKLIGVDTIHTLMDKPYILRIIPFIYAFLSLFITYKIGRKFFSRQVGLMGCIVLMTTLAYYNFSLQIRGYGLSTLLLGCIVYYSLSYLRSSKKRSIIFIIVLSALLFYTIPSNIYGIVCVMFMVGLYGVMDAFRKMKREGRNFVRGGKYLWLIIAMSVGVLIALLLYIPIFEDVFLNKYVVGGSPFNFAKLDRYFSHVVPSMLSGRLLFLICGLILVFLIIRQRKVERNLLILIVLCFMPLVFPFFRGGEAPLRVFVILAPYYALLFAIAVFRTLNIFVKRNFFYEYALLLLMLFYSLSTFYNEMSRAQAHLKKDIVEGQRSQDLNHQYYSYYYQPLEVVKKFKAQYKRNIPVVIDGCEPHGVTAYLDKFNIAHYNTYFQDNALDSLMSKHDSVYVITNHPNAYENINEYRKIRLKESLSYHNVLLLHRNHSIEKLRKRLLKLEDRYRDTVGFVFNVYNDILFRELLSFNDQLHFYDRTKQNHFGTLIEFCNQKPYLIYVETNDDDYTVNAVLNDRRKRIADFNIKGLTNDFYINKKILAPADSITLYWNNFEGESGSDLTLDSTTYYSGRFSEKLAPDNLYASGYTHPLEEQREELSLLVSFYGKFKFKTETVLVLTVTRDKEQILWKGQNLAPYYSPQKEWQHVIAAFKWEDTILPGDLIKVYIWNSGQENVWVDNFKVEWGRS